MLPLKFLPNLIFAVSSHNVGKPGDQHCKEIAIEATENSQNSYVAQFYFCVVNGGQGYFVRHAENEFFKTVQMLSSYRNLLTVK